MNKIRCRNLLLIFPLFFASFATAQSEPHAPKYFFVQWEQSARRPEAFAEDLSLQGFHCSQQRCC